MSQSLQSLTELPAGYVEIEGIIDALDECFMLGFSRIGQDQITALQTIKRLFTGSPLEPKVSASVDALCRLEFMEQHFTALAAARAALQGAQHDALAAHYAAATGHAIPASPAREAEEAMPPNISAWMESARHWLMELALAGFMQLDAAILAPFTATLEQLHEENKTVRLGMFLTGILREFMDALPVGELEVVPKRRWADLWTRGMIAATGLPTPPQKEKVSGAFYPLGCDLRHHPNAVSAVLYGVLEPTGKGREAQLVRMTLNSYKVDVVAGADLWTAIDEVYKPALQALADQKELAIKDMELRATGDLIFSGAPAVGKAFDALDIAKKHFGAGAKGLKSPSLDPLDRHPALLAGAIFLDGFKGKSSGGQAELEVGGLNLSVDMDRVSASSPLQEAASKNAPKWKQVFGLMRFDQGAWRLQPLMLDDGGKKPIFTGQDATSGKGKDTISILQERASKLLRQKS